MAGRSTGLLTSASHERRVPLRGRITKQIAACCIARLLVLATEHNEQPIVMYIDSPGGAVAESLPILSTMRGIRCPIVTYCPHDVSNTAAIIAACGLSRYRAAAPNVKFSFTPLTGSGQKVRSDSKFLHILTGILVETTNKPEVEVLKWLTQGAQFTAQQAVVNGLIDLVSPSPVLPTVIVTA